MRIVATEVVDKHRDLEADRALKVTIAVESADKRASDVVVVTDIGTVRCTIYDLVTAYVAPRGIIIFLLLASTEALLCLICPENCNNLRFPHH